MKSILSFLFLLLALGVFAQSEFVLDYPRIEKKFDSYQEIYRIKRTDTALILQGNVYHRPNYWVELDSGWLQGPTGKQYRFIRSYDYPMNKKVGMPASGSREFTFQFQLPDPVDQVVDYYDQEGKMMFQGIHLYPEKQKGFRCLIRGIIQDSAVSSRLILHSYNADIRVQSFISIPVRKGKFEYPIYAEERTIYTLLDWHDYIKGGWRPKDFWVELGTVEICYSPASIEDKETTLISDAPLNKERIRFEEMQQDKFNDTVLFQRSERLRNENRCYSQKMEDWLKAMENENINRDSMYKVHEQLKLTGEMYTPEMQEVNRKFVKRKERMDAFQLEYARKPSLNGLYILTEQLKRAVENSRKIETAEIVQLYRDKYQKKFAGHSMAEQAETYIKALDIKKGERFIDFTAPDLQGNLVKLSEYICGKVALIDLWASWCGSCRETSMSMISVYQDYKDKGFTIIGVARERGNTKAMVKAIKQDGYPWLNLVELNDRGGIWYKYGIGNAGGRTLLVDQNGNILAIRPTAEEVRKILQEILGDK